MASFLDLPNEIIDQVLSHIPRCDLLSICLVNKALKHSAEPFLYSTITLKYDYPEFPPIAPLLCTLLRRPALFDHINIVLLKGSGARTRTVPSMNTSTIPFDEFIAAVKKTKVQFTDIWIDKLQAADTCFHALAALLIAHLSKTTHLRIEDAYINGQPLISKIFQAKAFGQLPIFERLRELRHDKRRDVSYPDSINNHIFEETTSLFYVPTVVDLEVSVTNPETFRWPAGEPNLDRLTSLKIGWLCEPFLAKIFALTRNLRSLEWRWDDDGPENLGETAVIDFGKVSDAIQPLKNTLEKLNFWFWLGLDDERGNIVETNVRGNFRLRDFTRLADLNIPLTSRSATDWRPLALEDYAPDSVEVLTLPGTALSNDFQPGLPGYWDNDEFESHEIVPLLQSLADARPEKLPRLRVVKILDNCARVVHRSISRSVAELDLGFDVQFD
ncbi:unnamed protein product [Clonostachys rosea]|uniref:F-box domain-containing protein n=1 Tax=Bionectria ochroleuca TaxID=29856 RepID=A0ABY6UKF1_BIOOC|nr:unnamed protein product [Clonostachys rosea]